MASLIFLSLSHSFSQYRSFSRPLCVFLCLCLFLSLPFSHYAFKDVNSIFRCHINPNNCEFYGFLVSTHPISMFSLVDNNTSLLFRPILLHGQQGAEHTHMGSSCKHPGPRILDSISHNHHIRGRNHPNGKILPCGAISLIWSESV